MKWEDICKPKTLGGLGLKDWSLFNKALLGKWKWRFLVEDGSLWKQVLKVKYDFPRYGVHPEEGGKLSS